MAVQTAHSCASAFALCPGLRMLPWSHALSASVPHSGGLDERLGNSRIACARRGLARRKSVDITKSGYRNQQVCPNGSLLCLLIASLALLPLAYDYLLRILADAQCVRICSKIRAIASTPPTGEQSTLACITPLHAPSRVRPCRQDTLILRTTTLLCLTNARMLLLSH